MENIKNIQEWISEIKKSKKLVIVEGTNDEKALRSLGITNIFHLKQPIYEAVEKIAESEKETIILTDFDEEGRKLYGRLAKDLRKNGVKIDRKFREWLQKNTKLSHIEGITTYFEKETFKNK